MKTTYTRLPDLIVERTDHSIDDGPGISIYDPALPGGEGGITLTVAEAVEVRAALDSFLRDISHPAARGEGVGE